MIRPSKVIRIFTILPYMAVTVSVAGLMFASLSMKIDGSNKAFATLITRQAVESRLDQEARDKRQEAFESLVKDGKKSLEEAVKVNQATSSLVVGIDEKVSEGIIASRDIMRQIERSASLTRDSADSSSRAAKAAEQNAQRTRRTVQETVVTSADKRELTQAQKDLETKKQNLSKVTQQWKAQVKQYKRLNKR